MILYERLSMNVISRRVHGYLDYIVGFILIIAPWLLNFARGGAETWVPVILGLAVIIMAIFTDYELGLIKRIPFRTHLTIDFVHGILLAASPWLFDFSEYVYLPHLIFGLFEIGVVLMTERNPVLKPKTARS